MRSELPLGGVVDGRHAARTRRGVAMPGLQGSESTISAVPVPSAPGTGASRARAAPTWWYSFRRVSTPRPFLRNAHGNRLKTGSESSQNRPKIVPLTGNFFHLKDRDADIGMRVGLQAMGGARGARGRGGDGWHGERLMPGLVKWRTHQWLAKVAIHRSVHVTPFRAGSAANMWVVGCNVSAFNEWAARVLALGYTVAR